MQRLILHIIRNRTAYIIAAIVFTAIMGALATQVTINPDVEALIPGDDEVTSYMEQFGATGSKTDYLAVAVTAEDPFTPEILSAFHSAIAQLEDLPYLKRSANPFSLVTFRQEGRQLSLLPVNPFMGPPRTQEEIAVFKELLMRSPFVDQVLSPDGKTLCAFFPSEKVEDYHDAMREIEAITGTLSRTCTTMVTGSMPFTDRTHFYLSRDLVRLFSLAILVTLGIFYIGFKSKRAILLPISIVIMGTVWTLGFMALARFPLTVVSIIAPSLVLTLGSSYSIHLLNQYFREAPLQATTPEWIAGATARITKTIFLASFTTVIGFGSLITTKITQVTELGVSVSVGIVSCAVLALFFLPAALSLHSHPAPIQRETVQRGIIARLMERLGKSVCEHRWLYAGVTLFMIAGFAVCYPRLTHQTNFMKYFPAADRLIQDTEFINQHISSFQQLSITMTAPGKEKQFFLRPDILKPMAAFEKRLALYPHIRSTYSLATYMEGINEIASGVREIPKSRGLILLMSRYVRMFAEEESTAAFIGSLTNEDFSIYTITLTVWDPTTGSFLYDAEMLTLLDALEREIGESVPAEYRPVIWGNSMRFTRLSQILTRDQEVSTAISIVLVFLVSALFLRSFYYGLMASIPLITGVMMNFIFMVVFSIPLDMTTIMVTCVAIGVGVDSSIHFLITYQRQRSLAHGSQEDVIVETLRIGGRPIFLTTVSIVCGVLILTFSSFKPISFFGLLIAMALTSTMLGTILILPAFLLIFARKRTIPEARTELRG